VHKDSQVRAKVSATVKLIVEAEQNARVALREIVGSSLLQAESAQKPIWGLLSSARVLKQTNPNPEVL